MTNSFPEGNLLTVHISTDKYNSSSLCSDNMQLKKEKYDYNNGFTVMTTST